MARHRKQKGSFFTILIIIVAIVATIGLIWYVKNIAFPGSKSKPVAINPCTASSSSKAKIEITSTGVSPQTIMVCTGAQLEFLNHDSAPRKLTATSKGLGAERINEFDALAPKETVSTSFDNPETISYVTNGSRGTIEVR